MNKKTPVEMERARIIKVQRALIRLKHSLAADEELNERLPETLAQFDAALQAGELLQLPEGIFDETSIEEAD